MARLPPRLPASLAALLWLCASWSAAQDYPGYGSYPSDAGESRDAGSDYPSDAGDGGVPLPGGLPVNNGGASDDSYPDVGPSPVCCNPNTDLDCVDPARYCAGVGAAPAGFSCPTNHPYFRRAGKGRIPRCCKGLNGPLSGQCVDPTTTGGGTSPPRRHRHRSGGERRETPVRPLSDQEKALLAYRKTQPSPPATNARAGVVRPKLVEMSKTYLATPPGDKAGFTTTRGRLQDLEEKYIAEHPQLKDLHPLHGIFTKADEAKTAGNAAAGEKLVAGIRTLLRDDVKVYSDASGTSPNPEKLVAWAKALTAETTLDQALAALPQPTNPGVTAQGTELSAALLNLFGGQKVPAALAELVVGSDQAKKAKVLAAAAKPATDPDRLKLVDELSNGVDAKLKAHLVSPLPEVTAKLAERGISADEALAYFCARLSAAGASPGDPNTPLRNQLREMAKQSGIASTAGSAEGMKELASVDSGLVAQCTAFYNSKKASAVIGARASEFAPSLTANLDGTSVPLPGALGSGKETEGDKKGGSDGKAGTIVKAAVIGAIGGAVVGIGLFALFGPIGILVGALIGAAVVGGGRAIAD